MTRPHLLFAVAQHAPVAQRRICFLSSLLCLIGSLLPSSSFAQGQPGIPPFGSFGGPPDTINLANLNVHYTIPVLHKPGRGTSFIYDLTYDSYVWMPVVSGSTVSWQPGPGGWAGGIMGYITYNGSPSNCYVFPSGVYYYDQFTNFVFHDPQGTLHPLPGQITAFNQSPPGGGSCPSENYGIGGTTTDGSGLTYSISTTQQNYNSISSASIGTPDGAAANFGGGGGYIVDRNGNLITQDGSGHFYDTLSSTTPVLTLAGSGTPSSPVTYTYTPPGAGSASYTVKYATYTLKTNFGCSGIAEYGPTSYNLVSEVDLPDGSKYTFSYEPTPGYSGDVTGRIHQVTIPTGGTMTYTYSSGNSGINCSDGSTALLTRTTPDGTWSYYQVKGSGAASTTTITDPQANQTVLNFSGIYETQRLVYQGSSTLLETRVACYNNNLSNCPTATVTAPITKRDVYTYLPNLTYPGISETYYNAYGLLTEDKEMDFVYNSGGSPYLRDTTISYASLGNNIQNMPSSVVVKDNSGSIVAQTTFAYDETAVEVPTGTTPQHTSVTGSRGNATTIKQFSTVNALQGSTFLTSTIFYFDTGNPQAVSDVNGAATTFNYPDASSTCGNAFPTSISEPLGLSRSMTWNCTGGVQLTSTDENNQVTTTAYSDADFWRPASVTDQIGNQTTFYYQPNPTWSTPFEVASFLTFNNGSSQVSDIQYKDSLGRTFVDQREQSPGSSSLDSVSYTFDSNGRPYSTSVPCVVSWTGTCSTPKTTQTYDSLNRPLVTTDGGGGTVSYSYSGNDVLLTIGPAPSGENTKRRQLEYDALGRLTSVCEITGAPGSGTCGQNTSATGYLTKYTYDALGNLTGVTQNAQPGGTAQTRSYSFDGLSRLTSETNPESGTTNYAYDSAPGCTGRYSGDVVKRIDAVGNTACFTYDALHRNLSVTYPSGSYASVTPSKYLVYDTATVNGVAMANAKTRLAEAYTCTTCPGTKITDLGFSYTARGEASDVYQLTPHSSPSYYHVLQTYWPHGAPSQLSATVGGASITGFPTISYGGTIGSTVGLDGEGRITQVTAGSGPNPVTGAAYNVDSLPTQVTLGSGDNDIFAYDSNTLRMTQFKFNVGTQSKYLNGALTWNANGTLGQLALTDQFNSTNTQTCNYTHDDLTRIAQVDCGTGGWGQAFGYVSGQNAGYDAFGNLTKGVLSNHTGNSFQPTYSATTNHFASVPNCPGLNYDNNGNLLNDCNHTYTWDADGNSITVDSVGLTFDALDRMVEQNRSGTYTQVVYGPGGGKLALMSGQTLQKAFIPLPGQAAAVYTSSGLDHYRHSDWIGSARLSSSSPSQGYVSSLAYAPYGETYASNGTTDASFTGMNPDTTGSTTSSDYDFLFREYSNEGRWVSPDPAGLAAVDPSNPQSWNRYSYALNNPLLWTDPFGLDPCPNDQSWGAQLCRQAQAFRSTTSYNTWNPFFLLFITHCRSESGCSTTLDPNAFNLLGLLNTSGRFLSGFLDRTKTVNRCAGQLSQAGSVSNLSGGRVPEVLGSNTFGDVASLATGSGGLDQGAALAADATAHAAPAIATQVAVDTVASIGKAISNTPGVYNPVTVGVTTRTVGMTTAGKTLLGAAEGLLTGKILLDAGVYVGALVVCSQE